MYGVVLWSDASDNKAVIWCEDHGDLAYFGGGETSAFDGPCLDAGDLVHFQVTEGAPMRLAQNPQLVSESHAPALADRLRAAMHETTQPLASSKPSAPTSEECVENVVPFRLAFTA